MRHTNLPRKLDQGFYQKCRTELVNLCQSNSDIVSVYEFGTVSYPGISDLDFILCLKNKLNNNLDIEKQFSKGLGYITWGHVLKINEENFKDLCMIDDHPNLESKCLYGKKFKFSSFDNKTFEICRILDWLPERLFTSLKVKNSGQLNVMKMLGLIKSIAISFDKISKLTNNHEFDIIKKNINALRSTWFSNKNRLQDTDNLFKKTIILTLKAINFMDEYLIKNKYIFGDLKKAGKYFKIPNGPEFVFGNKAEIKKKTVQLPKSFFFFLAAQAVSNNGFISNHLKKSFDTDLNNLNINNHINNKLKKTIKKRIEYCDKLADFFRKNNLKTGLFKYGWFLNI